MEELLYQSRKDELFQQSQRDHDEDDGGSPSTTGIVLDDGGGIVLEDGEDRPQGRGGSSLKTGRIVLLVCC